MCVSAFSFDYRQLEWIAYFCAWCNGRKYIAEDPRRCPSWARILRAAHALSFEAEREPAGFVFEHMWPPALDAVTDKVISHASIALGLARTCGMRKIGKRATCELLRMPALGQSIAAASASAYANADLGVLSCYMHASSFALSGQR